MTRKNDAAEVLGLITQTEAAMMLGVSAATLRGWRANRRGPHFYTLGNRPMYRRTDVERWRDSQANTSRAAKPLIGGAE